MKIRQGFVSNSSSSSYLIVGVIDDELIKQLLKKDFPYQYDNGIYEGNFINFCCSDYLIDTNEVTEDVEKFVNDLDDLPFIAGIDIEDLFRKQNKNLKEIKEYFIKQVKEKFDIEIDIEDVKFDYGEVSSG